MDLKKEQVIFRGWRDIAEACGESVRVMKRIAKRYKMPYARLNGKATIARVTLIDWIDGLCKIVGQEGGKDEYVIQKLKNLKSKKD